MSRLKILNHINNIKDLAYKSPLNQKHVAIAIKNSKIISNPKINDIKPYSFGYFSGTCHAEINCISSFIFNKKLKKVSIIVIRLSRTGELRMSKPCTKCTRIMKHFGIKNVHYSTGDDRIFVSERIKYLKADLVFKEKPRLF